MSTRNRLDCGHSFHIECINHWFLQTEPFELPTCPCCRAIDDTLLVKIPIYSSSLMVAAQHGDTIRVYKLLGEGSHVDEEDFEGSTALSYAVTNKKFETASFLLYSGADINHIYKRGTYLLGMYANIPDSGEIVKFLLDNGIRTDIEDALGDTPLEIAAFCDNLDSLELLLKHGVGKIKSALALARRNKSVKCLSLLEKGDALEFSNSGKSISSITPEI